MRVLLQEDVFNLGYAGDVVNVADGYGRNYLLPRGLAVKATPAVLKSAQAWRERATARVAELRQEHQALAQRIESVELRFTARAGETGKLYGSVTTHDIARQLNELLGTEIDRRIIVGEPLRQIGEHRVTVRLGRDYQPHVRVVIHQEGAVSEVAEPTEPLATDEAAEAGEEEGMAGDDEAISG